MFIFFESQEDFEAVGGCFCQPGTYSPFLGHHCDYALEKHFSSNQAEKWFKYKGWVVCPPLDDDGADTYSQRA